LAFKRLSGTFASENVKQKKLLLPNALKTIDRKKNLWKKTFAFQRKPWSRAKRHDGLLASNSEPVASSTVFSPGFLAGQKGCAKMAPRPAGCGG